MLSITELSIGIQFAVFFTIPTIPLLTIFIGPDILTLSTMLLILLLFMGLICLCRVTDSIFPLLIFFGCCLGAFISY